MKIKRLEEDHVSDYINPLGPILTNDDANETPSRGSAGRQRKKKTNGKNGGSDNSASMTDTVPKTYRFQPVLIEKIQRVAFWQRRSIQDVLAEAIQKYLDSINEDFKRPKPGA